MTTECLFCCYASLDLANTPHKSISTSLRLKQKEEKNPNNDGNMTVLYTHDAEMQSKHDVIYAAVTFEACFLFTVVIHAASCPAISMLFP